MVDVKILDSSREFISNFGGDISSFQDRGFIAPEPEADCADEDEETILDKVDEFISKIMTMLTSLLEGKEDIDILTNMSSCLVPPDLKSRMLNVFGKFLQTDEINLFPKCLEG